MAGFDCWSFVFFLVLTLLPAFASLDRSLGRPAAPSSSTAVVAGEQDAISAQNSNAIVPAVTDTRRTIEVDYRGILPDLFRENMARIAVVQVSDFCVGEDLRLHTSMATVGLRSGVQQTYRLTTRLGVAWGPVRNGIAEIIKIATVSNLGIFERLEKYGSWISGCIAFANNPDDGGWRLGNYAWCASQYFPADPNDFSTWGLSDQWYVDNLGTAVATTHFVIDTSRNGQGPWRAPAYPDPQDWGREGVAT